MGRRHGVGASVRPRCGGRMLRIWVRPRAFQGGGGPSPKAALRGRRITAPTQEGSPDAAAHPHPSRPVAVESREPFRSEAHTSELQSLMRISSAVFCLKKKKYNITTTIMHFTTLI